VTLDQIYRAAARAGVAAACIGIPADLFHFTIESRAAASQSLAFRLHGVGLVTAFTLVLLALAGMVLAQQGRAGRLGLVGGLLALAGPRSSSATSPRRRSACRSHLRSWTTRRAGTCSS
jgi:hypothetical protein